MKTLIIDGRLGGDAEIRQTKNGKPYIRFSLANTIYANGQNTTEWYDVTSFEPNLVENRIKVLKKGTYVIVTGTPRTDVNVDRTNKVWVNQYLNAYNIELGASGRRESNSESGLAQDGASTYTGGTPSVNMSYSQPSQQSQPSYATAAPAPQPVQESVSAANAGWSSSADDDDLPF